MYICIHTYIYIYTHTEHAAYRLSAIHSARSRLLRDVSPNPDVYMCNIICMCVYIYIYMYIYISLSLYIYIYIHTRRDHEKAWTSAQNVLYSLRRGRAGLSQVMISAQHVL